MAFVASLCLLLRRFVSERGGNFAVIGVLAALPLTLTVGMAVDTSRYLAEKQRVQTAADIVALTVAASPERSEQKLRELAEIYLEQDSIGRHGAPYTLSTFKATTELIQVEVTTTLDVTFMSLGGYKNLPLKAAAKSERAVGAGSVEVALILDNTWSMSETDAKGSSKIVALKDAANDLADELLSTQAGDIKVGLVPFADYVNVGTSYRGEGWLNVADDYAVTTEKTCTTKTTKTVCKEYAPTYSCTKVVDGLEEPATCGGGCTRSETQEVAPYQSCSGGSTTRYKWYGCVGSRMAGTARLTDNTPSVQYPGYVETSQKCLNPIVPLTKDKAALTKAINGMIINIGSYKPYTYLPAGLTWGWNMLSPTDPIRDAAAYDRANAQPRKVAVLMTDGENTLAFRSSDGRHVQFSTSIATRAKQFITVNAETMTICTNMKAEKIEIFSVAFMVDDIDAKSVLKACASDANHYFDATDAEKLQQAFSGIGQSLRVVRLTY